MYVPGSCIDVFKGSDKGDGRTELRVVSWNRLQARRKSITQAQSNQTKSPSPWVLFLFSALHLSHRLQNFVIIRQLKRFVRRTNYYRHLGVIVPNCAYSSSSHDSQGFLTQSQTLTLGQKKWGTRRHCVFWVHAIQDSGCLKRTVVPYMCDRTTMRHQKPNFKHPVCKIC